MADSTERPTNVEIVNAIDWLHGDGEDIEFDEASWKGVNETGIIRTEGYVRRDDGKHYIAAKWQLLEVDYAAFPYDDEDWDL